MKVSKKTLAITLATVGIVGGAAFVQPRSAQAFWPFNWGQDNSAATNESGFSPIVERLMERFHLNEEEVSAELEQIRNERQAEIRERWQERLLRAQEKGLLTPDQVEAIKNKLFQNQGWGQKLRQMSPEERREAIANHRQEVIDWAEAQGIDWEAVRDEMGWFGFGRSNRGAGMGFGGRYQR